MNWNWLNRDMVLTVALWMQSYLLRKWKKKWREKSTSIQGISIFHNRIQTIAEINVCICREKNSEWMRQRLIAVYEFFTTSPAIAKCSMKKFIRVFMPFSEYISDSRTHPLPTTISRNSDVSITNWGTYKKWTKNTKPN